MKKSPKQIQKELNNPVLFSYMNSYLNLQAHATLLRQKVDEISAGVLAEVPMFNDRYPELPEYGERVTVGRQTYLSGDEAAFQRYLDLCDERERAAGIKPADMDRDHCPASTVETQLSDIRREIEKITLPIFDLTEDSLWHYDGKTKEFFYQKWIKLMIGAVVNHPNFKARNFAKEHLQEVK